MFYSFKSKFLSVALAFFISVSSFTTSTVFASSTENSDLAQNLGWSIENGILTINQNFPMDDYNTSDKKCPWYARKDEITKVKFDKDTLPDKIGSFLFYDCKNLTEIDISADKNLKSIAKGIFLDCINLEKIYFPKEFESSFFNIDSESYHEYYGISDNCMVYFVDRFSAIDQAKIKDQIRNATSELEALKKDQYCMNYIFSDMYRESQQKLHFKNSYSKSLNSSIDKLKDDLKNLDAKDLSQNSKSSKAKDTETHQTPDKTSPKKIINKLKHIDSEIARRKRIIEQFIRFTKLDYMHERINSINLEHSLTKLRILSSNEKCKRFKIGDVNVLEINDNTILQKCRFKVPGLYVFNPSLSNSFNSSHNPNKLLAGDVIYSLCLHVDPFIPGVYITDLTYENLSDAIAYTKEHGRKAILLKVLRDGKLIDFYLYLKDLTFHKYE